MSITKELIDGGIVIKNFVKINTMFYKFFNKEETKKILKIFKIYDGDNNESIYIKNFLIVLFPYLLHHYLHRLF